MAGSSPPPADGPPSRDAGLEVEAAAVGPGSTRAPVVALVVLVAFLGAAIVKPWEIAARLDPAAGHRATASEAARSAEPATTVEPRPSADRVAGPRPGEDLRAAATPHSGWGVRGIARLTGSGATEALMLADRWTAVDVAVAGDVQITGTVAAGATGDIVLAVEVTAPPDGLILELRVWRIDAQGSHRIAPRPVPGPETGSWLWLPDPTQETPAGGWAQGMYRFDVVSGPRIVRIAVSMPGTDDVTAAAPRSPPQGPGELLARINDWVMLSTDIDHLAAAPLVSDRDRGGTDVDGTCGGSATITSTDERIGILSGVGRLVTGLQLFAIDTIRRPDVDIGFASDAVTGLTVVALPSGGIAARQYALIAATTGPSGSEQRTYTICVR